MGEIRSRTVLVGAAGTGTSFALASRLKANWGAEVKIVAIDVNPAHLVATSLIADAFVQAPPATAPDFLPWLEMLMVERRVDIFFPILNEEIAAACELRGSARLADVDFVVSDAYGSLTDKAAATDWLTGLGLPVPATFKPGDVTGQGRYFCKPKNGTGSRDARVMSGAEIAAAPDAMSDLIIQEVLVPPEVTVDSFFDAASGWGYAVCRERIEIKSGVCTKARVFRDEFLEELARRIGRGLGQKGAICFQVMSGEAGWCVTDLNLRTGAGTAMTCAAGVDVLSAAFALRVGQDYQRFFDRDWNDGSSRFVTRQYSEFLMRA